jgi:hypothetical protein
MDDKTISVPLTSFRWLGILIIGISVALVLNTFISINSTESTIASNFTGGLIGGIIGICFLILSNRKRKINFNLEIIEYVTKVVVFSAKYSEINLIKTFIDPTNKSENILIFVDENRTVSFTTSFFPREKLIEVYNELLARCSEFIIREELTVDNKLNW